MLVNTINECKKIVPQSFVFHLHVSLGQVIQCGQRESLECLYHLQVIKTPAHRIDPQIVDHPLEVELQVLDRVNPPLQRVGQLEPAHQRHVQLQVFNVLAQIVVDNPHHRVGFGLQTGKDVHGGLSRQLQVDFGVAPQGTKVLGQAHLLLVVDEHNDVGAVQSGGGSPSGLKQCI